MRKYPPVGIILIIVWFVVFTGFDEVAIGLWTLFSGLQVMGTEISKIAGGFVAIVIVMGVALTAHGGAQLFSTFGLWQLKEWGRNVAAIASAVGVVVSAAIVLLLLLGPRFAAGAATAAGGNSFLISALLGQMGVVTGYLAAPAVMWGGVYGVVLWYLLRQDVIEQFEGSSHGYDWGPDYPSAPDRCPGCQRRLDPGFQRCPWCGKNLRNDTTLPGTSLPPTVPEPAKKTEVVARQAAALGFLYVQQGPDRGKRFDVSSETKIGRERDCHVILSDPTVSRDHARIRFQDNQFRFVNVSQQGTTLNGYRVQDQQLRDNDTIVMGETHLVFKSVVPARAH